MTVSIKDDDSLVVICSPIRMVDDMPMVNAHITRRRGSVFDAADVRLPAYSISGVYGFSADDVDYIIGYAKRHHDILWDMAAERC
jgi:hypothetical protein